MLELLGTVPGIGQSPSASPSSSAMSLWWLVASHASSFLLSFSLVAFGYVVPALSSIKAVVHRDPEAYTQWVSYWLILYLLNLMDSAPAWLWSVVVVGASSPVHHGRPSWLRVPLLLWLSLPRYRGASVLYEAALAPFLHDDDVERKVDGRLGELWRAVARGAWAFASAVARQATVAALTTGSGWGGPGNLDWMAMAVRSYSGRGCPDEEQEDGEDDDDDGEAEERRLSPHHSLRESSSASLANFDSRTSETANAEVDADDAYAEDFASLLSRGLYVFALDGDGGEGDADGRHGGGGTFKLRVLSYRPRGDGGGRGCGVGGVLVLSRVDRRGGDRGGRGRNGTTDDDGGGGGGVVLMPLRDVDAVEPSGSRNVLLRLVSSSSCYSPPSIVDVMLSDGEDRDTLLAGLRSLCRRFRADVPPVPVDGDADASASFLPN